MVKVWYVGSDIRKSDVSIMVVTIPPLAPLAPAGVLFVVGLFARVPDD